MVSGNNFNNLMDSDYLIEMDISKIFDHRYGILVIYNMMLMLIFYKKNMNDNINLHSILAILLLLIFNLNVPISYKKIIHIKLNINPICQC